MAGKESLPLLLPEKQIAPQVPRLLEQSVCNTTLEYEEESVITLGIRGYCSESHRKRDIREYCSESEVLRLPEKRIAPQVLRLVEQSECNTTIEDEEESIIIFGLTQLVKRKHEMTADLYADVKYIFHTSYVNNVDRKTRNRLCSRPLLPDLNKNDEFEQKVELPRLLPDIRDFSDKLVLFYEPLHHPGTHYKRVMVFLIDWCEDTRKVSLFHVFTRRLKDMSSESCGYAAIGERLYIVGGCYRRPKYARESEFVQHLDIPTYNLRTKEWEMGTPPLNGAKPKPVVFVYEGKIFAIRRIHPYACKKTPKFEFLDLKCQILGTPRSWTELPAPPCDMKYYWYHILDETNGILFLFFNRSGDRDKMYSAPEIKYSCCQLNLKEKPYQWNQESCISKFFNIPDPIPKYSVLLTQTSFPCNQSRGCIVDDIIFFYQHDHELQKPVICGQYMDWDKRGWEPCVFHVLDEVLKGKVQSTIDSVGYLTHIGKFRFCLNIEHSVGPDDRTEALYSLIFDLVKKELPNEYPRATRCDASKAQKASKFEFVFKHVCDGAFQVPQFIQLLCCQKL